MIVSSYYAPQEWEKSPVRGNLADDKPELLKWGMKNEIFDSGLCGFADCCFLVCFGGRRCETDNVFVQRASPRPALPLRHSPSLTPAV